MILAIRRLLISAAVGAALTIGLSGVAAQAAPTPTPSTTATVSATPAAGDNSDTELNVSPDVAPDNSRSIWILGGVGVLAVVAAAVVIARR